MDFPKPSSPLFGTRYISLFSQPSSRFLVAVMPESLLAGMICLDPPNRNRLLESPAMTIWMLLMFGCAIPLAVIHPGSLVDWISFFYGYEWHSHLQRRQRHYRHRPCASAWWRKSNTPCSLVCILHRGARVDRRRVLSRIGLSYAGKESGICEPKDDLRGRAAEGAHASLICALMDGD